MSETLTSEIVNPSNRSSLLSPEALSVAESFDLARQLWEDPSVGELAAEEFLGRVRAAREQFHKLLAYPVIGFELHDGEAQ